MKSLYTLNRMVIGHYVIPAGSKLSRIDAGADFLPPEGTELRDDDDTPVWNEPAFTDVLPPQVDNFKLRESMMQVQLTKTQTLFEAVNQWLKTKFDESTPEWQAWEYKASFERNNVLVKAIATQFRLTDTQIDALFMKAKEDEL